MLNQVCVLTVKVDDIEKAVEFYTQVLSFKVSKYYGEKLVSLVHNDMPIVLEETEAIGTEARQSVLLGILSENLDKDVDELKAKGAEILFDEPQPCPPGRYTIIKDPAGNQIEIVEFSS
ncbi:VOC family protein [Cytobacillus massiliigabonensis]|uniref:VOC family protein n=1 Tax=Cytobacillus massiliigabonensis TaxID=1871011 RepID=UPI0015E0CBE5|nr:VOC family protein [Cytobacillus massiliigabonensis]